MHRESYRVENHNSSAAFYILYIIPISNNYIQQRDWSEFEWSGVVERVPMLQLYDDDDTKRARGGGSEKAVASVVVWQRDEE